MSPVDLITVLDELRVSIYEQDRKIKFLEDNAFSDRARIVALENELEHYKKHINEELAVALAPFKYYVNEMISLSSKINELEKEVFPEIYGDE